MSNIQIKDGKLYQDGKVTVPEFGNVEHITAIRLAEDELNGEGDINNEKKQ